MDVARGFNDGRDGNDAERQTLLPMHVKAEDDLDRNPPISTSSQTSCSQAHFTMIHLAIAFLAGTIGCFVAQYAICGTTCFSDSASDVVALAPPYVGSTTRDIFPPTKPTNAFPSLFPTNVGYGGGTPTGAEPALIATAPSYPMHTGAAVLVGSEKSNKFDLFKKWGNLSPWYSVDRKAFGLDSGPEPPETCRITGLHFLHRHGARYPTAWGVLPACSPIITHLPCLASYGGPANFSSRLNAVAGDLTASGDLEFLNEWYVTRMPPLAVPLNRAPGRTSWAKKVA